jgi:transposase
MAYRYGERLQSLLLPPSIKDFVRADDPVRAYDAFVDVLDLDGLGIAVDAHKRGCPEYSPCVMLKILVFGYAYGIRSSRKLERALYHNIAFIWLAGGLKPDHKTICEFRRQNKAALKQVLRQCARFCIELDLIEGNTLFVDGTKMRANASINQTWNLERCEKAMEKIEHRIEEILAQCEQADQQEKSQGSLVQLKKSLARQQTLQQKVKEVMEKLKSDPRESLNSTDPECVKVQSRQGTHAGYNGQIVVDEQNGLIVHCDVVAENNDRGQFANQIDGAQETLKKPCEVACADAGYSNAETLEPVDQQGIRVIVPSEEQVHPEEMGPFDKSRFQYIAKDDVYLCPAGQKLPCRRHEVARERWVYGLLGNTCRQCQHFGVCTTNRLGRKLIRYDNEAFREKMRREYDQPSSRAIFSRRKETAELPFGHIKRNLGAGHFLIRGLEGARAEMSLLANCFNVARLIGIFGVSCLLEKLGKLG